MHPFSTPWKNQKTVRFTDVFRGYRKRILGTNGLTVKYCHYGYADFYECHLALTSTYVLKFSMVSRSDLWLDVYQLWHHALFLLERSLFHCIKCVYINIFFIMSTHDLHGIHFFKDFESHEGRNFALAFSSIVNNAKNNCSWRLILLQFNKWN